MWLFLPSAEPWFLTEHVYMAASQWSCTARHAVMHDFLKANYFPFGREVTIWKAGHFRGLC